MPPVKWDWLVDNGVFVLVRAGQADFEDNLFQGHYNNGIVAGHRPAIYWFNQPNMRHEGQVSRLLEIFNRQTVKPCVIALDCENISYYENTSDSASLPLDHPLWSRYQPRPGITDSAGMINIEPPSKEFATFHTWQWMEKVGKATDALILLYSRKDYIDKWLLPTGTKFTYEGKEYIAPVWSFLADSWPATWTQYGASPLIFRDWLGWVVWQYLGGTGRIDGVIGPCDQNYFNGTQSECNAYFEMEEGAPLPMTAIHNTLVAQANRAKILTLEGSQKPTLPPAEMGVDAVILPMGGMDKWDGNHMQHYVESTFAARCAEWSQAVPVLGLFRLSPRYWGQEQYSASTVEGMSLKDNFILGQLINAWHNGAWTMDSILAGQGKWQPISALILSMTETGWYAGQTASVDWQARTFINVAERVKFLQDGGFAPKIPVIMYTGPWWLDMYDKTDNAFQSKVLQSATYKPWLSLLLGQWVRSSTSVFDDLPAIFAFPPDDTFKFGSGISYTYPDGYFNKILGHEFTGDAQRVKTVTDAAGNAMTVKLALWCDTKEKMYEYLNFIPVVNPPPPPPPPPAEGDLKTVLDKLAAIEVKLDGIKEQVEAELEFQNWLKPRLQAFIK